MNKKMTLIAAVSATLLSAAVASASGGWTPAALVTEVLAGYSTKDVYVTGLENTAGCTYATIRFTTSQSDPVLVQNLALAAMLSGKKLACAVDGCNGSYQSGRQCMIKN